MAKADHGPIDTVIALLMEATVVPERREMIAQELQTHLSGVQDYARRVQLEAFLEEILRAPRMGNEIERIRDDLTRWIEREFGSG